MILVLNMNHLCVFVSLQSEFYQNIRKQIDRHRAIQSELRVDFLCIGQLRSRSFQCIWFRCPIRNIASQNCKTLSWPENIRFETALPKCVFFHYVLSTFLGRENCLKTSYKDLLLYALPERVRS